MNVKVFHNQILAVGEDSDGLVKTERHTVVLREDYNKILEENNKLRKKVIDVIRKMGDENASLQLEIKQLKCPHSVDVLGVCEWCGAGAEPEHLDNK